MLTADEHAVAAAYKAEHRIQFICAEKKIFADADIKRGGIKIIMQPGGQLCFFYADIIFIKQFCQLPVCHISAKWILIIL